MEINKRRFLKSCVAFLLAFLMIAVQLGPVGGAKVVRADGDGPAVYGEDDLVEGLCLNVGDQIRLDKPFKFKSVEDGDYVYTETAPADTDIEFTLNTGYDRYDFPYAFVYDGKVRSINARQASASRRYAGSYSMEKVVIQNITKSDTDVNISSLKLQMAYSGYIENFAKYDILVGSEFGAHFATYNYSSGFMDADKIFKTADGSPFTASGIDANGNFINQAGDIVCSSSGNNAWLVVGEYDDEMGHVYVVEPYNFEAYVNVNVEEGIEVTGVEDGRAPVFGMICAKSKDIFAVFNKGYYTTVLNMPKDEDGYYTYQLSNIVNDISIENRKVLYTKYDLMEARVGDIYMPVETYHIARDEETPTFGQFSVTSIWYKVVSDKGYNSSSYIGTNSSLGVFGDVTVYAGGALSRVEDHGDSGIYTYTYSPMVDANTPGNSWIIKSAYDSSGGSGRMYFGMQGYYHNFYTRHEAVAPTCTQAGTIEYWTDIDGNKFADDVGKIPIDDITDPATGHAYDISDWEWTQTADGYSAKAIFECGNCHDIKVYDAVVSKASILDVTYYTAIVNVDGVEYSAIKEVEAKYTFEVENGRIVLGEKDSYSYADAVTVRADAVKDGKTFAGWYLGDTLVSTSLSYTFYVKRDMVVTARYEDAPIEEQAVAAVVITRTNIADNKQKVVFSLTWSLPKGYRLLESGIVRAYDNGENLDLEHVDNTNIKNNVATNKTANGNCNFNLNVSATTKLRTIYATAYVKYLDKSGAAGIAYSPVQVSAYE